MQRATNQFIKQEHRDEHKRIYTKYKDVETMCEVNTRYLAIHSWLLSNEAASDIDVSDLDTWLGWWHFRYRQWGGYMQLVSA